MTHSEYDNHIGPAPKRPSLLALLAVGAVSGLAGLAAATQKAAYDFEHQPALGASWEGIYLPWKILEWGDRWAAQYPDTFTSAHELGQFVGLAMVALGLYAVRNKFDKRDFLYGTARYANETDVRRANLLPPKRPWWKRASKDEEAPGVIVGSWKDRSGKGHYLWHRGPEHVLIVAPTRSGKGVGLVVPTLLSWSESTFVTDLKGELHALTAGWRQKYAGNKIVRLDFANPEKSARWNPLLEVARGSSAEIGDVKNIALMLIDPDGKGIDHDHWRKTGLPLLAACILHVLHLEPDTASLARVAYFVNSPETPLSEKLEEMVESPIEYVAVEARKQLDRPPNEAGSVISTAMSALAPFLEPGFAQVTSRSDFQIRDLKYGDTPMTVYLVANPKNKDRTVALNRLFLSMVARGLVDELRFEGGRPVKGYKHKTLFLFDEFVAFGKISIVQESLAYMAAYGVKAYLIVQTLKQLTSREYGYGPDQTISANCHVQIFLRPDELETAEFVSKKTGTTTQSYTSMSYSGHNRTRSTQYVQRPLLTPNECMTLPGAIVEGVNMIEGGEMLVFVSGTPVIRGPQPLYFKDPMFSARAAVAPPKVPVTRTKS